MLTIVVPHKDVLRILDMHPSHIVVSNLSHQIIVNLVNILLREVERDMPYHNFNIWAKLGLQTEGIDDGVLVCSQHAFRVQQLGILLLLGHIADCSAKVMPFCYLCHHGESGL